MSKYDLSKKGDVWNIVRNESPKLSAKIIIEEKANLLIEEMEDASYKETQEAIIEALEFVRGMKEVLKVKVPSSYSLESVNKWFRLYGQS
jgi:hypothetical protein